MTSLKTVIDGGSGSDFKMKSTKWFSLKTLPNRINMSEEEYNYVKKNVET